MTTVELAGKMLRIVRRDGWTGLSDALVRRVAVKRGVAQEPLAVAAEDVADSALLGSSDVPSSRQRGAPLDIGWVITPPGPGSGGHTTIFRMVEAAEAAGHRCTLFTYNGSGHPTPQSKGIIRQWWPRVKAGVADARDGLPELDVYVATAWPTAHALATRGPLGVPKLYLAQDFEPYFYAVGPSYALAEDTYKFGFRTVAIGHMVANEIERSSGVRPVVAEFGCDHATYHLSGARERTSVVFYSRPDTPRRGHDLGVMALERFHRLRPHVDIHVVGSDPGRLPFPAVVHGKLAPSELNALYNVSLAGLALSFTNVSLLQFELLAAGVVPVVNDWSGTRADLDNEFVQWARPTPQAVADALVTAVDLQRIAGAQALSQSVSGISWQQAQETMLASLEEGCDLRRMYDGGSFRPGKSPIGSGKPEHQEY